MRKLDDAHGSRSAFQSSMLVNSRQNERELSATSRRDLRPKDQTKWKDREPLSNRSRLFSHVGKVSVKREILSTLAPRIYKNGAQHSARCERFFRLSMGVLLNIEGKCSPFRAKAAHISGHLPVGNTDCSIDGWMETPSRSRMWGAMRR